jgi:hypothetical protein
VGLFAPGTTPIDGYGWFTLDKQPTAVVITGSGANALSVQATVYLFNSYGAYVDRVGSDPAGVWSFYDLDDGLYYAHALASAEAFSVLVSGTSVTITKLGGGGGSGGTVGFFFAG